MPLRSTKQLMEDEAGRRYFVPLIEKTILDCSLAHNLHKQKSIHMSQHCYMQAEQYYEHCSYKAEQCYLHFIVV